mgnify:CR=1 FL=1
MRLDSLLTSILPTPLTVSALLLCLASALVLGIERPEGPVTNPSAGERLHAGDVVWAVGDPQRMKPFFEAVRQE